MNMDKLNFAKSITGGLLIGVMCLFSVISYMHRIPIN